jgi:ribosome-binding protein aMBF1 (putative translation factor)
MQHQDWNTVVFNKKKDDEIKKKKDTSFNPEGTKKFRNLDSDDPDAPEKVSHDLKIKIQQARTARNLTQKQLATQLNIPVATISNYENGKEIPTKQITSRISKILGVRL